MSEEWGNRVVQEVYEQTKMLDPCQLKTGGGWQDQVFRGGALSIFALVQREPPHPLCNTEAHVPPEYPRILCSKEPVRVKACGLKLRWSESKTRPDFHCPIQPAPPELIWVEDQNQFSKIYHFTYFLGKTVLVMKNHFTSQTTKTELRWTFNY